MQETKITNVEISLKNEQSTIIQLKDSTVSNKKYLMDTLEILSNNFNTNNIIDEPYMLPHLFRTLNESLSKVNSNILKLNDLESTINNIILLLQQDDMASPSLKEDIHTKLNSYNLKKMEYKTTILNNSAYIDKFISSSKNLIDDLTENIENSKENLIKQFKENRKNNISPANTEPTSSSNEDTPLYKSYKIQENNTLLISEKQAKVFLPYTLKDLYKFSENNEDNIEEIIRENFVISLNAFKNPTISRFKETYNLAKNKSGLSLLKSFQISVETMFDYNLNPAIIMACKNIDELKSYLTCLKEQKLDLFKPFKIKYEMNPMKI